MSRLRNKFSGVLSAGLTLLATPYAMAQAPAEAAASADDRPMLGVFTTMPLTWGEAPDLTALVRGGVEPHWARAELEEHFVWAPLDVLGEPDSGQRLDAVDALLLAQPRALAGVENVALDDWVRAGGRVLLFADPAMSGESLYAFGDRRRPHDVTLLSPILARWGLELVFDEASAPTQRSAVANGVTIPVNLPGRLQARTPTGGAEAGCVIAADAITADCRIGAGRVLVVADAALLDYTGTAPEGHSAALDALVRDSLLAD